MVSDLVMRALEGKEMGVGPGARLTVTVFAPSHNINGFGRA